MAQTSCDFSFSGLKTAVRQAVEKLAADDGSAVADLCASFQRTVGDVLADRCANAFVMAPSPTLVVAGGVATPISACGTGWRTSPAATGLAWWRRQ